VATPIRTPDRPTTDGRGGTGLTLLAGFLLGALAYGITVLALRRWVHGLLVAVCAALGVALAAAVLGVADATRAFDLGFVLALVVCGVSHALAR
jgi:hypothetical protein